MGVVESWLHQYRFDCNSGAHLVKEPIFIHDLRELTWIGRTQRQQEAN